MDIDLTVGCILIVSALATLIGLVAWSHRIINRIAERKLESARDIMRDLSDG